MKEIRNCPLGKALKKGENLYVYILSFPQYKYKQKCKSNSEAYSEYFQPSKMELFAKIVNG